MSFPRDAKRLHAETERLTKIIKEAFTLLNDASIALTLLLYEHRPMTPEYSYLQMPAGREPVAIDLQSSREESAASNPASVSVSDVPSNPIIDPLMVPPPIMFPGPAPPSTMASSPAPPSTMVSSPAPPSTMASSPAPPSTMTSSPAPPPVIRPRPTRLRFRRPKRPRSEILETESSDSSEEDSTSAGEPEPLVDDMTEIDGIYFLASARSPEGHLPPKKRQRGPSDGTREQLEVAESVLTDFRTPSPIRDMSPSPSPAPWAETDTEEEIKEEEIKEEEEEKVKEREKRRRREAKAKRKRERLLHRTITLEPVREYSKTEIFDLYNALFDLKTNEIRPYYKHYRNLHEVLPPEIDKLRRDYGYCSIQQRDLWKQHVPYWIHRLILNIYRGSCRQNKYTPWIRD